MSSPVVVGKNLTRIRVTEKPKWNPKFISPNRSPNLVVGTRRLTTSRIQVINADPAPVEVTWQIAIGALAGVAPFVVAGVEFTKRIVAQRKCRVCKGSGLVLRDKYYFRCPGCGGFLPWQSWRRFFSG